VIPRGASAPAAISVPRDVMFARRVRFVVHASGLARSDWIVTVAVQERAPSVH
jgi:hypothetical protein